MHLSESCVCKNTIVFHKLQAALLVVTPHAGKMPAKVMIGTRRAVEVKQSQSIFLDHATAILFRSGILYSMVLTLGRNFRCYWVIIWFYKADTASSMRCYCSIFRINNRRFSPDNNQSAWTMHSLKSTLTHILPCHTLTHIVWALVCATAPPIRSPAKTSAILNEYVTAVTASRFSPVLLEPSIRPSERQSMPKWSACTA